jgi:serine/threonine protein kinase
MEGRLRAIGKYAVLAELAHGGMADVFLAVARGVGGFNKLVVIKRLRASLADEPEFHQMFLEEARLAARLSHPNVVQTNEVGVEGGWPYIAMEYLEGQPLHRIEARTRNDPSLTIGMKLRAVADACAGLHHAHELADFDGSPLGVVHRDVSPHNVFVTYDGQVKVVDFGIAKTRDSSLETRVGTLKGKVAYMAPEQARGDAIDRRADVWGLGMILWELVAGRRMWSFVPDPAIFEHLLRADVPSLGTARRDAPEAVVAICDRALACDREGRYPTAEAMRVDIERVMAALDARGTSRDLGACVATAFVEQRDRVRRTIDAELSALRGDPNDTRALARLMAASTADVPTPTTNPSGPSAKRRSESQPSQSVAMRPMNATNPPPAPPRDRRWTAIASVGVVLVIGVGVFGLSRWMRHREGTRSDHDGLGAHQKSLAGGGSDDRCLAADKPIVELSGDIDGDATLTCDKTYLLKFTTFVRGGATLTIQPGTTVLGDGDTKGTLVVQPGGKLIADGTRDRPIVFTSPKPEAQRAPGDWGGVILLGNAPTNLHDASGKPIKGRVEGITTGGEYGGDDANDDSGVLRWVRIEYSGVAIGPNNEINGVTLAGVGRGTKIDHVEVRRTADDCFEFFGGTVDAKHLICQSNGDDGFDWDFGYTGRLQFLFLQQDPDVADDTNGFEGDNDPNGTPNAPRSAPTIYNATLCGKNKEVAKEQYGMLLRRGTHGTIANAIVTGFEAAVDVRETSTKVDLTSSIAWGNVVQPIAYAEDGTVAHNKDDDGKLDEVAWFLDPKKHNRVVDPGLPACFDLDHPKMAPAQAITEGAATPPDDGFFDPSSKFIGAFRDVADDWASGEWIRWSKR